MRTNFSPTGIYLAYHSHHSNIIIVDFFNCLFASRYLAPIIPPISHMQGPGQRFFYAATAKQVLRKKREKIALSIRREVWQNSHYNYYSITHELVALAR